MPASCGAGACTVDVRRNSLLSIVLSTGISALCISQYESEFVAHSLGTHSAHRVSFQGAPSVEFSWSQHLSPQLEGVFRRMLPASVAFALCVCCSFLRPLFECSSASFHHHRPPRPGGWGLTQSRGVDAPEWAVERLLRCLQCRASRGNKNRPRDQEGAARELCERAEAVCPYTPGRAEPFSLPRGNNVQSPTCPGRPTERCRHLLCQTSEAELCVALGAPCEPGRDTLEFDTACATGSERGLYPER